MFHSRMIRTFKLVDCVAHDCARIGGEPPASIDVHSYDELTQYFGTFPIPNNSVYQFSLFHRFDLNGDDESLDVILHNNQILEPSSLIWVAIHIPSTKSSRFAGSHRAFSPCCLKFSDEIEEEFGSTSPCTENKMGGMAYAERHQVVDAYRSMPHLGYTHLLQIGQDGLSPAGFPWDPGYLNVWSMDPLDPNTYRFCIQQ